jgi:hypothetical protein
MLKLDLVCLGCYYLVLNCEKYIYDFGKRGMLTLMQRKIKMG